MDKRLLIALSLAAPIFLATACGERDYTGTTPEGAIDAGEIAKRPDAFYGRPVTVVADIEATHGPNAFTLDEDEAFAGPDVLVIARQGDQNLEPNTEVMVQGTVRPLVVADLERDYDWFDPAAYQGDLLARFKDRPVIIADVVRPAGGDELAGAREPAPAAPVP